MFDKIKGNKTAKKISTFFSENYNPLSDSMFNPKQNLNINTDSPETLKFIQDITLFLNGEGREKQLYHTMKKLHINDLVSWSLILKEIVENYGKNLNIDGIKYTSSFYHSGEIDSENIKFLDSFLKEHLAKNIRAKAERIDTGQRAVYIEIAKKLEATKASNAAPQRHENGTNNEDQGEQASGFTETPSNEFIKNLKNILDNTFIPVVRSESNIPAADLEIYRKIVSILPNSDQSFDNTYSKFVRAVGESELIKRCILDKNFRKEFSPKQIIKLQRYYDIASESTQKKKGKVKESYINYTDMNDDMYNNINLNELDKKIPHGAITFDPRYKNDKNLYYINPNPIDKASGFATLHDIGVDNNQQDVGRLPTIEAHTSSNGGGSQFEITHCFFRIKATEFDPSVLNDKDLKNHNKDVSLEDKALRRRSYSFGFYPKKQFFLSEKLGGTFRSFPGELKDDRNHYSQLAVARSCNNGKILEMNDAVHKFTKENNYSLFSKNCTAFVSKVSKEIGFKDISEMFGKYIFTPNRAAKNIISAWMSGEYNGTDTTFKATNHKMKIYKQDKNGNATRESEYNESFYAKHQGILSGLELEYDPQRDLIGNIINSFVQWRARAIISMENMELEDNDDMSYSQIKDYLVVFIKRFYDGLPDQRLEFTSQLGRTLPSLKELFDLTEYSEEGVDERTLKRRKLAAKNQLNLLGNVFKNHNNYRGFLFVKFLIKRIDAGMIELLIKKGHQDAIQEKLYDANEIYNKKLRYFNSVRDTCSDEKYYALEHDLDDADAVCEGIEEQLQSLKDEYLDMINKYHENFN